MLQVLSTVSLFQALTPSQQSQLMEMSHQKRLKTGEVLFQQNDKATDFYLVIEGTIEISQQVDNQEILAGVYGENQFFGEVPLLAGTPHLATAKALINTTVSCFPEETFWYMLCNFPSIRQKVMGFMANRMSELQTISQHYNKMTALGTLAAGLAHELNNPASAAQRAVGQLEHTVSSRHTIAYKSLQQLLPTKAFDLLLEMKNEAIDWVRKDSDLDPLSQIDWEDELATWLDHHDIADAWSLAPTLVTGRIKTEQLDGISQMISAEALPDALLWLETMINETVSFHVLTQGINRMCEIVSAVKSYSYLDQAHHAKKRIDLHHDLDNTLTILKFKLRKKNIAVVREYDEQLPPMIANGNSLNQVWTNLLDNAIDATETNGKIWIRTFVEQDYIMVEISDNGAGIPADIQSRIFEPFFTTKKVGQGMGMGLNLVYKIVVGEHNGTIRCLSEPGLTSFFIHLPRDLTS
ncbi:ATP-binding protein [Crocosphaera sp.]|uniref:ATP-binding protein n=1 Tax=Crocosphaera sp. TaxID=2729996 RepID=UPI003F283709|nr:ATP-binding protein [Crocosphaera sp.]